MNPFAQQLDTPMPTLYREQETRVCHNAKEYEAAQKEGFHEWIRAEHEYPKMLHHPTEEPVVVHTPEQEQARIRTGWSEVPSRTYPLKERGPLEVEVAAAGTVSVQYFMSIIATLQMEIAELKAGRHPEEPKGKKRSA